MYLSSIEQSDVPKGYVYRICTKMKCILFVKIENCFLRSDSCAHHRRKLYMTLLYKLCLPFIVTEYRVVCLREFCIVLHLKLCHIS